MHNTPSTSPAPSHQNAPRLGSGEWWKDSIDGHGFLSRRSAASIALLFGAAVGVGVYEGPRGKKEAVQSGHVQKVVETSTDTTARKVEQLVSDDEAIESEDEAELP